MTQLSTDREFVATEVIAATAVIDRKFGRFEGESAGEVFVAVCKRMQSGKPINNLTAYIRCVASHYYHREADRRKREECRLERLSRELAQIRPDEPNEVPSLLPDSEPSCQKAALARYQAMGEGDQRVIASYLHLAGQPSVAKLAKLLGISRQALHQRGKRLVSRLSGEQGEKDHEG